MAGNAVIGALRIVLGADSAALEKGLKEAQSSVSRFATSVTSIAAGIGLERIIEKSVSAVVHSIKSAVENADKLGKSAQKIGIPVEELSALKYAADLADVSIESLEKGVVKLSKTMVSAAVQPTGEAARAFKAIGVAVTDSGGKLRNTQDVINDVAERFSGLKDGAGKAAVAVALFGRAGADLIPLLNEGKGGLQHLMEEAEKLGIVITSKTARAAQDFNDDLKRLGYIAQGLAIKLAEGMLPALQQIVTKFIALGKENLEGWGRSIGGVFVWIIQKLETLAVAIGNVGRAWAAFKVLMLDLDPSNLATNFERFDRILNENAAIMTALAEKHAYENLADAFGPLSITVEKGAKALKDFNYAALAGKNALDQYLAGVAKRQAGLDAELQTIGLGAEALARSKIQLEAEAIAKEHNIVITDKLQKKIDGLKDSIGGTTSKIETMKEQWSTIKGTIGSATKSFEDALVGIADGSKTAADAFRDMAKSIVSDLIRMAIRLSITIPLANALNNAFGGGFNTLFGGGLTPRASGGPVTAGKPYLVGERRPEIFVPNTSGTILPNAGSSFGRSSIVTGDTNITIQGSADMNTITLLRQELAVRDRNLSSQIVRTVRDASSRRVAGMR